jgi:transglutaminase-like putative cysteine protease
MIHTLAGENPTPGPAYLAPTRFLDCDAPSVRDFAERTARGATSDVAKAVNLFYAIRDDWRYDPFCMRLEPAEFVASVVHARESAWCVQKASLLAASARAIGIPAAVGMSDVMNHLTTDKLKARMGGSTLFIDHGYAVLHLGGRWVKAAPVFNIELCRRFGVLPTEFDGTRDAIFQEFDAAKRRHMEYVADHGAWSDFPYDRMAADMRASYPPELFGETPGGAPPERFEDGVPVR